MWEGANVVRVRIQWSLAAPQDWQTIDVTPTGSGAQSWRNLAKKGEPTGSETIDGTPGWVNTVEVDGVLFQGFDHYAADFGGSGNNRFLRVYGWSDDTDDFADPQSLGYRWGERWEFRQHRSDPKFGGAENTWQVKTVFAADLDDMGRFFPQETSGGPVLLRPWSEWVMPPADLTRHGIWMPEPLLAEHVQVRSAVDWRGWA
jgi:hypothetical protein